MLSFRFNYHQFRLFGVFVQNMQFHEHVCRHCDSLCCRLAAVKVVGSRALKQNKTTHRSTTVITVKHISIAFLQNHTRKKTLHHFPSTNYACFTFWLLCSSIFNGVLFCRQITLYITLLNLTK